MKLRTKEDFKKIIEEVSEKGVNTYYDLNLDEIETLCNMSRWDFKLVHYAFLCGYYQGVKATQNSTPWETTRKKNLQERRAKRTIEQ